MHDEDDWTPVRFDGLRFAVRILRQWRFISVVTLLSALVGLAYALTRKPFFEATATFLPPVHEISSAGQLSAYSIFSPSLQATTYLGFLDSKTVQRDVVKKLNLTAVYKVEDADSAASIVGGNAKFDAAPSGIIFIRVQASTPQLSADIANSYLSAVHDLTRKMAEDALLQRSSFYAEQLKQSRQTLEQAESSLQANQERSGILDPAGSTQIAISTQARLQASIQAAQVQLSALLQSNTESSPAVIRARSELAELHSQLSQQSANIGHSARGVEAGGALPGLNIQALRRTREVKEREAVYESLLHQTELNRIGQEDPGPELQIIDMAAPPKRKAGPKRMQYLVWGTLSGFTVSLLWTMAATWLIRITKRLHRAFRSPEAQG